jgi:hypothetical protein
MNAAATKEKKAVLIATSATMSPLVMASLLRSSRDQFCNLHMGLQGGIYDGWDNRFFYRTTSDDLRELALAARRLWSEIRHAERRDAASMSALVLTSKVTSWIANDAGHKQSVDVSYFAQTPDGQRPNRNTNRYAITKRSVFISTC